MATTLVGATTSDTLDVTVEVDEQVRAAAAWLGQLDLTDPRWAVAAPLLDAVLARVGQSPDGLPLVLRLRMLGHAARRRRHLATGDAATDLERLVTSIRAVVRRAGPTT